MGREWELEPELKGTHQAIGKKIVGLREVSYGRTKEILDSLDLRGLLGRAIGIRFVDLEEYLKIQREGLALGPDGEKKRSGGIMINPLKTEALDPDHVYVAISQDITDSTLIHEIAHVLDHYAGSRLFPWVAAELSLELDIPVEHLEHLHEFGYWLDWLANKYQVELDADDTIILHLYKKGLLIKAGDVILGDKEAIRHQSQRILKYLSENSAGIDDLIKGRKGYIGPRPQGE